MVQMVKDLTHCLALFLLLYVQVKLRSLLHYMLVILQRHYLVRNNNFLHLVHYRFLHAYLGPRSERECSEYTLMARARTPYYEVRKTPYGAFLITLHSTCAQ